MTNTGLQYWSVVAYDGKHLVVKDEDKSCHIRRGVARVYDMEANSWGPSWFTKDLGYHHLNFYKFTPSLSFYREDKQTKVVLASDDKTIHFLTKIMRLTDPTK
ncbi:unnamed protein product [Eruca vesicaria subsp. sativa]|uniref:Uncharacterized protein n=1 Tax=Eruca vesicaria subsp. sativa TaxID=29727 RepID=A0ABC8KX06_ERUVS|nr:unnamed protein product [Eruca vesicaria subsp. sativa]